MTWYEAVAYGNRLSEEEGLPPEEWHHERNADYQISQEGVAEEYRDTLPALDNVVRALRGGAFASDAAGVRSAFRCFNRPDSHYTSCGFRPARTMPPTP